MPEEGAERSVEIRGEMIRLGQLIQFAGIVDSGVDARRLLEEGGVTVNGEPEARRGRQLRRGDLVSVRSEDVSEDVRIG